MSKIVTPETFIDKLVKRNELGQPFALTDHQRVILRARLRLRQRRAPALGHDHLFLRQEVGQDHAERRLDAGLGIYPRGTERNLDIGQ